MDYFYLAVGAYTDELHWFSLRIRLIVCSVDLAIVGLGLLELNCELLFALSLLAIKVPFCIDHYLIKLVIINIQNLSRKTKVDH